MFVCICILFYRGFGVSAAGGLGGPAHCMGLPKACMHVCYLLCLDPDFLILDPSLERAISLLGLCVDPESGIDTSMGSADLLYFGKIFTQLQKPFNRLQSRRRHHHSAAFCA